MADLEETPKKSDGYHRMRRWVFVGLGVPLVAGLFYQHTYTGVIVARRARIEQDFSHDKTPVTTVTVKLADGKQVILKDVAWETFGKAKPLGLPKPSKTAYHLTTRGLPFLGWPNVMQVRRVHQ